MNHFLRTFCKQHNISLKLVELDILRNARTNFALESVRTFYISKIERGEFDLVLSSPPCSTFSRAPWANLWGPRPIRSFLFPRGLTTLKWSQRMLAKLGNTLADFSFAALKAQLKQSPGFFVKEQPEDLGAVRSGPYQGQRPASMWQFAQHADLLSSGSVESIALFQSDFGAQYPKPTRLLLNLTQLAESSFYEGTPTFDKGGGYTGPLPKCTTATTTLKRKSASSPFATSGTAAWPPKLCEWISKSAILSFIGWHSTAVQMEINNPGNTAPEPSMPSDHTLPIEASKPEHLPQQHEPIMELGRVSNLGGFGPPRSCKSPGKLSLFHDGATLASPGRWDKDQRNLPAKPPWTVIRHSLDVCMEEDLKQQGGLSKRCFQLAKIKSAPCSDKCINDLASLLADWLINHGSLKTRENLLSIAVGQPFRLSLIKEILKAANDPDYLFLDEMETTGVTVGVLEPMPRTPAAFEEQTTWRLEDDPFAIPLQESANYSSVAEHAEWVRQHLEEEVREGLMEKIAVKDLENRYGKNVAIASLAVIYDPISEKRRLVHDATHKVRVNHRIRCRDKLRMPGPREKFYLLDKYRQSGEVPFSIIADVSKAHRRVRHKSEEHGLLACKISEGDEFAYVNKVGTFGVSSAAYWWTRLFATCLRAAHYLMDQAESGEVLTYADDVELLGANKMERRGITKFLIILTALGTPFKWEKLRGGLETDWIGFHTNYALKQLGLSVKRSEWITSWCNKIVSSLRILPAEMVAGLGRLGYAANALYWEKPFLGPIYAWTSAIARRNGMARVPWAVALLLSWIARRLSEGGRLQPPPSLLGQPQELFRTDAKAEGGKAYVGGWETFRGLQTNKARWFAVEVSKQWAPWVWCKQGDPGRVIASLELLATLMAIILFKSHWQPDSSGMVYGTGITDNKGNSFAVQKMLSTKFPLTVLLIELSEQLRSCSIEMHLEWLRRDDNQEADDLTNQKFSKFSPENRIQVDPSKIDWLVLPELMSSGQDLYARIVDMKQRKDNSSLNKLGHGKRRSRGNHLTPW